MSDMRALFADPIEVCARCAPICQAGLSGRSAPAPKDAPAAGPDPDGVLRALLDQQIARTDELEALIGSLDLPILQLCADMRLVYFTKAAAQLFGLCAADLGERLNFRRPPALVSEGTEVCRAVVRTAARADAAPLGDVWHCRVLPHYTRAGAPAGAMVILLPPGPAEPLSAPEDDLTPRQRQVMDLVLAGHPSKNIAADLKISQRTVENHRAAIMRRTGATSLPALARLALGAAGGDDCNLRQGRRAVSAAIV